MNKELELEVEKYCEKVWGGYKDDVFKHDDIITDKTLSEISKTDFIAGTTSKWVEKQKLEFAIGLLKVIEQPNGDLLGNKIKQQIIILEQTFQKYKL